MKAGGLERLMPQCKTQAKYFKHGKAQEEVVDLTKKMEEDKALILGLAPKNVCESVCVGGMLEQQMKLGIMMMFLDYLEKSPISLVQSFAKAAFSLCDCAVLCLIFLPLPPSYSQSPTATCVCIPTSSCCFALAP